MQTIYIEKAIASHPRTLRIIQQLQPENIIECDFYKEVFNPKAQNFRIQKQNPALILAEKKNNFISKSPPGFGIGGDVNYYFSHMLNCLFDCRYCFLQGMYSSANYVVFVNYEDFMQEIVLLSQTAVNPIYFFSGYDCDSLAYEPVTYFLKEFLPFFQPLKNAILELRTKSTNIKELLHVSAFKHCVVAFSLNPDEISQAIEKKVPPLAKRLQAMQEVANHGWPIGLRFDPLIYHPNFKLLYQDLIETIFKLISPQQIHSISVGTMRFPEKMYQTIVNLYPNDALLAHPLYKQGKTMAYRDELEQSMKAWVYELLSNHVNQAILFECKS